MKTIALITLALTLLSTILSAQSISVDTDSYEQEFLGTGASCGLWLSAYLGLTEENQLKASQMLYEDLGLDYVKNYDGFVPEEKPEAYDKVVTFFNNAKIYNPNVKLWICVNNLPDHLEEGYGTDKHNKGEHDQSIPGITDSLAHYYYHVCRGYFERNAPVAVLELVNERGYDDGKVTEIYSSATTKLRALMSNSEFNKQNVPMPLIAGPATWSAKGTEKFINGWKKDTPEAWNNVDIVTTHAYQNGHEMYIRQTTDISDGKPFYNSEQTGKLQKDESNGISPLGEQFEDNASVPEFVQNASIAYHMFNQFAGGGNGFFNFLTHNYKNQSSALVYTPWGGVPEPSVSYNGFKHLAATHPKGSKKVDSQLSGMDNYKVVSFREEGTDTVYVHFLNQYDTYGTVTISLKDLGIKAVQGWRTDESLKFGEVMNSTFDTPLTAIKVQSTPYSVNTYRCVVANEASKTLQDQSITFEAIGDQEETISEIQLTASSSSNEAVTFTVLEGPATINGSTLNVEGVGYIRVEASTHSTLDYYEAEPVVQDFFVRPSSENIALNKTATASSEASTTYTASKVTDGDLSSNNSRWLNVSKNDFDKNPQWVEIDLGKDYIINTLCLFTGKNGNYNIPICKFELQVEQSGSWEPVLIEDFNFNSEYLKGFTPVIAQKVRIYISDANKGFQSNIYEIQIFGDEFVRTNVAEGGLVTVSSNDSKYPGSLAVDGNNADNASRWVSDKNQALPQWIEVDLQGDYTIDGISMWSGYKGYNQPLVDFTFEVWDGSQWSTVITEEGNEESSYTKFFTPVNAQKVKVNVTELAPDKPSVKLYELRVYKEKNVSGIIPQGNDNTRLKIYPNPTSGFIHIEGLISGEHITVTDLNGRERLSSSKHTIDVSMLPSGIYILATKSGEHALFTKE